MSLEAIYRLSVVLGMTDNLTAPLSGVENNVVNATKKMTDVFDTMQKAGTALMGVGAGITSACLATVTSTFQTQDALGELASLGVSDLEAVENAAKNFSDTWAGTTKSNFITAAYDIKSGIASLTDEGVAQFTELAALTGKATKSTTEEMGSLFATGYGIYKGFYEDMSDLEFGGMFSAGIATAVKNYKTSGSEMASSISALGATATNNNVPLEEQLAILGQLQTTMSGSEAATKYKSFLNQAASAGDKLGLSFVDANNQLLSTPEILEKLQSKYGDTIDAMEKQELKAAFGTDEAVAMIDLLYSDIQGLSGGIDAVSASLQKGTAVTQEMAEAINNTPAQKFEVLKQQIHNNVEELGNGLLPVANETMEKVSGLIQKGSEWIGNNQETVQTIMNVALRLGILLAVLGVVITTVGTVGKTILTIKTTITTVKTAWTALSGALGAAKTAWTGLSGAFAVSPIGLVVIAVIALVAAFVLLWNKSEAFRNFWTGLFDRIEGTVSDSLNAVRGFFENIMGAATETARSKLNDIKNAYEENGGGIKGVIAAFLEGVKGYFTAGLEFVDNLTGGKISGIRQKFEDGMQGALGTVNGKLQSISGAFNEKMDAIRNKVSSGIEKIKRFFNIDLPTPRIKMPHVNISGEFSLSPPSTPKFSIDWYAKGGIMTAPTIFGASGNKLLGGGEAGPEAVLPLSALWSKLKQFIHEELETDNGGTDSKTSVIRTLFNRETKTLEKKQDKTTEKEMQRLVTDSEKRTVIQKLELNVDISKIKDLTLLLKLIDELKDAENSTDEPVIV